jgi:hypothetical protein
MSLEQHRKEFNKLASKPPGNTMTILKYLSKIGTAIQCADYESYNKRLQENGDFFRKLHDYYGWKAKNAQTDRRGGCAGSLYRSSKYMKILPDERIGSRKGQNVHIEHVVPINLIPRLIWGHRKFLNDCESIFDFVLKISVCAAVDQKNERGSIDKPRDIYGSIINCREQHPGIKREGDAAYLTNEQPFSRYIRSDVSIYTMSTGKEICFETYTYEEHLKALKEHKAFQWNAYNS